MFRLLLTKFVLIPQITESRLREKFPFKKNFPENVSVTFIKLRKFFRQGNISENYGELIYK
jgi:hypothetical protein